jgi:hypothetical protein
VASGPETQSRKLSSEKVFTGRDSVLVFVGPDSPESPISSFPNIEPSFWFMGVSGTSITVPFSSYLIQELIFG